MQINIKSYSTKSSLLSSIIFFIIGAILTAYADKIMKTTYILIGAIFLLIAIVNICIVVYKKKKLEPIDINKIGSIIIALVLSILFFFFHNIIDESIRFIVGAWILFTGITRLISALRINHSGKNFISLLIISALLIILGIYTILTNGILVRIVGIILMIYSAIEIVGYIFYSKDNINYEDDDTSVLLITEKEDKKNKDKKIKKIKDVSDDDIEEK